MKKIGVLAVQGAVVEHFEKLQKIEGVEPVSVKYASDLEQIHGVIIPGGESTAIGRLLRDFDLMEPLRQKIQDGLPVWGTCAGMIILAKEIANDDRRHLKVMDIEVSRNGYGRQLGSFITEVQVPQVADQKIPLVFIRAPYVTKVGAGVEVLLKVNDRIVACRQDKMLVTSFHPELTDDLHFHQYFSQLIIPLV